MKKTFWSCFAVLALFLRYECGVAAEKSPVSIELHDLVARIQSKLDQGKKTQADLASDLKEFDNLLEKYAGQKTDDVAQILLTESRLYLQELDDSAKSRQLVLQLRREFPLTTQGAKAEEMLTLISRHEEAARIRSFLVAGNKFPDFAEKDLARKPISLSAHKGKVVLLEFWATWSKASVAEAPYVLAVYDKYHAQGFEIIGISLDDDQLRLSAFTTRNKMPWPQFWDGAIWHSKLVLKYGVNTVPANYLLDPEGTIIAKNLCGHDLDEQIAAALARK